MAAKTCFDCAHNLRIAVETGFAGSTSRRESFGFVRRAAETRYAGLRCVKRNQQRGSSWVSAPPTDRQRIAFIQYYAEGKTYQEIADAMGCTKQTVYESVQRALTRVRSFFKEN